MAYHFIFLGHQFLFFRKNYETPHTHLEFKVDDKCGSNDDSKEVHGWE